jgi:NADPH2:quinone reductase
MELGVTPIEAPGEGQVLVKVEAIGVNFIETYQRSGVYAVDYPFTPGTEFSGTVTELGQNVRHLKVGDRVATSSGTKGYAQFAVVDENQ